jgi:mannose-6-phosphate isomerase-like protein (cupin superfamily)
MVCCTSEDFMSIRSVVTGQAESGKSIVVRDAPVEPITVALLPGFEFHRNWGSDSVPTLPSDGSSPPHHGYYPPEGGFRFGFVTIPPGTQRAVDPADMASLVAELQEKLPGMAEVFEPDHPGMHTTDTVDIGVVLSGEVYLELDDGAEVRIQAGDCVIQNGTRHAWHNRSSKMCVLAVTMVGAERTR